MGGGGCGWVGFEGWRVGGLEGRVRGFEGSRVRGFEGRVRGFEGSRVRGFDGRVRGFAGSMVRGFVVLCLVSECSSVRVFVFRWSWRAESLLAYSLSLV